jgi:hypothetical protein
MTEITDKYEEKDRSLQRLRSITNVISIKINNTDVKSAQKNENIFSFAKTQKD